MIATIYNHLHRLALGSVQFGLNYGLVNNNRKVPFAEVGAILGLADARKIRTLDTALAYGDSEVVLGEYDIKKFWDNK